MGNLYDMETAGDFAPRVSLPILEKAITLTIEECYFGCNKSVTLEKVRVRCSECDGTGNKEKKNNVCQTCKGFCIGKQTMTNGAVFIETEMPCPTCNGKGYSQDLPDCDKCSGLGSVEDSSEITIAIRPGMWSGFMIRCNGRGHYHKSGITAPVMIKITAIKNNNTNFKRENNDLVLEHLVKLYEIIGEDNIEVQHIDGTKRTIPVNINSEISIPSEGFTDPNNGSKGSFRVRLTVDMPMNMPANMKQMVQSILKENANYLSSV
jgi:molecular chaperone DnaJ